MTTAEMSLDLSKTVVTEARKADQDGAMPSGWWLLPLVVTGSAMWVGLFMLIF